MINARAMFGKHGADSAVPRRAVTLTELLVVLVIISLLATVAVPIYVNKVEQAKIATARMECREIAQAQLQCNAIHGFFVPLQMLDDLIYDEDNHQTTFPATDDLENEDQDLYLIRPTLPMLDQDGSDQLQLRDWDSASSDANLLVYNMYVKWAGPFLNPQRVAFAEEIQLDLMTDSEKNLAIRLDYPLDPWGNPYRFYSPLGIIGYDALTEEFPVGSPNDKLSGTWEAAFDGRITTDDDRFDTFAIVSFGPNLRTDAQGSGTAYQHTDADDIIYLFGANYIESSFRAF